VTDLPNSGQTDSMDNVAVTREDFRQDIGEFLQYTAQALGNITGTYTTETIDPTQVILRGTPTLAAGAEASASDVTLRLANTRWVKYNANSRGTAAPSNPVDGQTWVDLSLDPPVLKIWDETNLVWAESSGGASVETGATPPTSPSDGDMWWNTDDGRLYIYYTDADSSQWVDASPDSPAPPDLWSRTGTTISPAIAGDDIFTLDDLKVGGTVSDPNIVLRDDGTISAKGRLGCENISFVGGANSFRYDWQNTIGESQLDLVVDDVEIFNAPLCLQNKLNFQWSGSDLQFNIDNTGWQTISTTSDYRLKENITPLASAIDRVKQLKPCSFNRKDYAPAGTSSDTPLYRGSSDIEEGFIAHEVQEVIPSGATYSKDSADCVQALNLSPIVSVLTKALQEALTKIEALETKVAALEGGAN